MKTFTLNIKEEHNQSQKIFILDINDAIDLLEILA